MIDLSNLDRIALGPTDIQISPLGIGTWAWGDRMMWQYGKGYGSTDIEAAYQTALAHGINFFDTAELYGRGRSETFLGQFIHKAEWPVVVATKFFPYPWRVRKSSLGRALIKSLQRLGMEQVDLYQMHWPFPLLSIETWMDAMADAVEAGLVRAVGVSNYDVEQTRRAQAALARRGIPLAANQVEYSLLQRKPETSGLLDACRELGVTVIAYSPLAKGALTGKYTPENLPPGLRRGRYNARLFRRIQPLLDLMREIGQRHGARSPAQVALNWTICKGTVPIPGAKNARQALDNAGALGWRLSEDEVVLLDEASEKIGS